MHEVAFIAGCARWVVSGHEPALQHGPLSAGPCGPFEEAEAECRKAGK